MKVSCLQENLVKGLRVVERAAVKRSTLPVLENVKLETDQGRLKLSATDLEMGINCWVGCKVHEEGAITVPAKQLTKLVKGLPRERVDLEVGHKQTLDVSCCQYQVTLQGIEADEFPVAWFADGGDVLCRIAPDVLKSAIKQVVFAAAAREDTRAALTGVLFSFDGRQLTLVAADGFRLSERSLPLAAWGKGPMSLLIPARALEELGRLLGKERDLVEVSVIRGANKLASYGKPMMVSFRLRDGGDVELVAWLVENATFPNYKLIMPVPHTWATFQTSELLSMARIVRDTSEIGSVKLAIGADGVTLTTNEDGQHSVGRLAAVVDGEPAEVVFGADYLVEALSVIDSEQVALGVSNGRELGGGKVETCGPCLLRPVGDDSFLHLLMPRSR